MAAQPLSRQDSDTVWRSATWLIPLTFQLVLAITLGVARTVDVWIARPSSGAWPELTGAAVTVTVVLAIGVRMLGSTKPWRRALALSLMFSALAVPVGAIVFIGVRLWWAS